MNVVLKSERESVVDDILYVRNVETPGGDIGGDQERDCAGLELVVSPVPLVLAFIAMNGDTTPFVSEKSLFDSGRLHLIQHEDDDFAIRLFMILF